MRIWQICLSDPDFYICLTSIGLLIKEKHWGGKGIKPNEISLERKSFSRKEKVLILNEKFVSFLYLF